MHITTFTHRHVSCVISIIMIRYIYIFGTRDTTDCYSSSERMHVCSERTRKSKSERESENERKKVGKRGRRTTGDRVLEKKKREREGSKK